MTPREQNGNAGPGQGTGNSAQSPPVEPPPALSSKLDEATHEFSRKATELTIQRLRGQLKKGDVDQELLDRLQWSKQDMERWVSRWEEMFRRSAQKGKEGEAARVRIGWSSSQFGFADRTRPRSPATVRTTPSAE